MNLKALHKVMRILGPIHGPNLIQSSLHFDTDNDVINFDVNETATNFLNCTSGATCTVTDKSTGTSELCSVQIDMHSFDKMMFTEISGFPLTKVLQPEGVTIPLAHIIIARTITLGFFTKRNWSFENWLPSEVLDELYSSNKSLVEIVSENEAWSSTPIAHRLLLCSNNY